METKLPKCPECKEDYAYIDNEKYVCPMCAHECEEKENEEAIKEINEIAYQLLKETEAFSIDVSYDAKHYCFFEFIYSDFKGQIEIINESIELNRNMVLDRDICNLLFDFIDEMRKQYDIESIELTFKSKRSKCFD